jgi:hypothetical protein
MLKIKHIALLLCLGLLEAGCQSAVLKQDIPVSSNPMGANIFADGKLVGQTPTTVSLERTKNHILTLVKDNYRQEDVSVTQQYQSNKVLRNAVLSGVDSGLFFKDKKMAVGSAWGSISSQEASGAAYVLVPATVSVDLIPLGGSATAPVFFGPGGVPAAGTSSVPRSASRQTPPPATSDISTAELVKTGIVAGAAVAATDVKPIEKKWQTSSSTKSYVTSDGTQVTKKSSTSVGVGVNPAGAAMYLIDKLFN